MFEAATPADGAMMGFDETDLLLLAESAGFSEVNVTLELSSSTVPPFTTLSWDQLMMMRPNPNAPSYGEAIHEALSKDEAQRLEGHLRPLMEGGAEGRNRAAVAYLTATKPAT